LVCALVLLASTAQAAPRVLADARGAGVQRDDRIVALHGTDADGAVAELATPDPVAFQWQWLRCSAMRRCAVQVERGEDRLSLPLWTDDLALAPDGTDAAEAEALGESAKDSAEGDALLAGLAMRWRQAGRPRDAAWVEFLRAQRAIRSGQLDEAVLIEPLALQDLRQEPRELALQLELNLTVELLKHGHAPLAEERLQEFRRRSLPMAVKVRAARAMGALEFERSRLAEAEAVLRPAVELARREAPASHLLSGTLNALAVVVRPQGRLQEAGALFDEALQAARAFDADSLLSTMILSNRGLLKRAGGDLAAAEADLREALAMESMLHRQDLLFDTQSNLALVLLDRGRTREAAALLQQQVPVGSDADHAQRAARAQQNLALVYAQQGNLLEAVRRLRQAAAHLEAALPGGLEEANARLDLGLYAALAGELDLARSETGRALDLHLRLAPRGTGVVAAYDGLALVALRRGDLDDALALQQRALALRDLGENPGWRRDFALVQLARIELGKARAIEALRAATQAQRLAREAGRDAQLAAALALEGDALLSRSEIGQARKAACAGVEIIERLRGTSPGGAEFRSGFAQASAPVYRSCMDALLAGGDTAAALDLYQAERRLTLNALIEDRDLRFSDLPASLATERRSALMELARVAGELDAAHDADARQVLLEARDRIRQRLRRVDSEVLEAVPRLATWREARDATPQRAPEGQRVLAFSVRESDTLRVVLEVDRAPRIERLPIDSARLGTMVADWSRALRQRDSQRERRLAGQLHAALLQGLALQEGPDALVIVPDGPLHGLPFAALLDEHGRRLVETHSIALSALLPDARAQAAPAQDGDRIELLALAEDRANAGGNRPELPGVEAELETLAALPWSSVLLLRGERATAEALHTLGPKARRLHIATHGINDPQSPLDSALMLLDASGRPRPLPVWDIFETLRLDAELVVLAACETAPGAGRVDDGWLGLTRAFQFAGAERVVSALWAVDDDGTARLMSAFHRLLAQGLSAELALAQSQRQLLSGGPGGHEVSNPSRGRNGGEAHRGIGGLRPVGAAGRRESGEAPYYWAGFQLYLAPH